MYTKKKDINKIYGTKKPVFSVIIPLYNKEKYIKRAINSVLKQTYQNFEIIVINDGSTDNSLSVIKSIKDKRVKIFNQKNLGVSNARNKGIKKAKGEYIAFLDADDKFLNNYLETIVQLILKYPNNSFFGTAFKKVYKNNDTEICDFNFGKKSEKTFIVKDLISAVVKNKKFFIHISSIVIKKEIFDEIGYFRAHSTKNLLGATIVEDFELVIKIAYKYPLIYSNNIGCIYYLNTNFNLIRGYGLKELDCTFYEDTIADLLKISDDNRKKKLKKLLYMFRYSIITQCILRNKFKEALDIINQCNQNDKRIIELKKIISLKQTEWSLLSKRKTRN
jgi:glycosyltransferase involved in cell wall biosynthesis